MMIIKNYSLSMISHERTISETDILIYSLKLAGMVGLIGWIAWLIDLAAPAGVDWRLTFSQLDPFNPYSTKTFTNPPWTVLFIPHAGWLAGNGLNLLINISAIIAILKFYDAKLPAYLMILSFPPAWDLARTNNIDYIPLIALMIPPQAGLILLACKPHSLGLIAIVWLKRHGVAVILPLVVVILASFIVWGWWPAEIDQRVIGTPWNFAPFPALIPVGLYILYQAWRADDPAMAALATPLISPYVAAYSFAGPFAILAARWPRLAFIAYSGIWWYIVVEIRRH